MTQLLKKVTTTKKVTKMKNKKSVYALKNEWQKLIFDQEINLKTHVLNYSELLFRDILSHEDLPSLLIHLMLNEKIPDNE